MPRLDLRVGILNLRVGFITSVAREPGTWHPGHHLM